MTGQSSGRARLAAALAGLAVVSAMATAPATAAPAAAPATTTTGSATASWTHNPASPTGPVHWGALDPAWSACASTEGQSPVVITTSQKAHLPALFVQYTRAPLVVENTGHVVEVPQPAGGGGTLVVGDRNYRLVQWHIHAPSEHVIDGHRADVEIHLVHENAQGQNAVVAIFADTVASRRVAPGSPASDLLRTTLRAAPFEAGEEIDLGTMVSAAVLLGGGAARSDGTRIIANYLTYTGSLTTPPCTGGIRWFVLPRTIRIDQASVQRLHTLIAGLPGYDGYPENNRPVQPLGSRTVQRRLG
jgi:carbonic anhydrase